MHVLCGIAMLLATNGDGVVLLGPLVVGGTQQPGMSNMPGELVPPPYTPMLAPVFFFTFFVVLLFFFLGDDDDLGRSAKC